MKSPVFTSQFIFFLLLFPICPCITHTSFFTFHSETSKTSLTLLLPAKTFSILTPPKSSSFPTILTFLKFLCSVVVKGNVSPVVYQVFVFVFTFSHTYDLWHMTFAYVIFQFQFLCSGFFRKFYTHILQGSIWYLIKQFRDLFDGF